jgi:enediyne biosynthesis protein E4
MLTGVAVSADGLEQGSMGVDWGDYLNDGRMGIIVTNFTEQPDTLYRNLGQEGFSDVSYPSGLAKPTYPYVAWGTAFFDMDNDGWLDLFIANGHVYPQVDTIPGGAHYREPLQLFRNKRDGTFEDVSSVLAGLPEESRRGAAFGDVNNDGNIDVVLVNVGRPPALLINRGENSNHRVLFKLTGSKSNRMAIGARVTVKVGGLTQLREVRAGASYISQNDPRLHFGLGRESRMERVEIRWPNGNIEVLKDVAADFIYELTEGRGIQQKTALPAITGEHLSGNPDAVSQPRRR